ncbi:hypothetical protein H9P43_004795 [Blastocladiella emersonii ATCC 22665]|nr:hypothetical protein H9P43_004795 [Blastocladiella emersonii ATCC 22665]
MAPAGPTSTSTNSSASGLDALTAAAAAAAGDHDAYRAPAPGHAHQRFHHHPAANGHDGSSGDARFMPQQQSQYGGGHHAGHDHHKQYHYAAAASARPQYAEDDDDDDDDEWSDTAGPQRKRKRGNSSASGRQGVADGVGSEARLPAAAGGASHGTGRGAAGTSTPAANTRRARKPSSSTTSAPAAPTADASGSNDEAGPTAAATTGSGAADQVPPRRRKRLTKACDTCRRRKIKCDGNVPCGPCKGLGQPDDCAYRTVMRKRAAGSARPWRSEIAAAAAFAKALNYINALQQRVSDLEQVLAVDRSGDEDEAPQHHAGPQLLPAAPAPAPAPASSPSVNGSTPQPPPALHHYHQIQYHPHPHAQQQPAPSHYQPPPPPPHPAAPIHATSSYHGSLSASPPSIHQHQHHGYAAAPRYQQQQPDHRVAASPPSSWAASSATAAYDYPQHPQPQQAAHPVSYPPAENRHHPRTQQHYHAAPAPAPAAPAPVPVPAYHTHPAPPPQQPAYAPPAAPRSAPPAPPTHSRSLAALLDDWRTATDLVHVYCAEAGHALPSPVQQWLASARDAVAASPSDPTAAPLVLAVAALAASSFAERVPPLHAATVAGWIAAVAQDAAVALAAPSESGLVYAVAAMYVLGQTHLARGHYAAAWTAVGSAVRAVEGATLINTSSSAPIRALLPALVRDHVRLASLLDRPVSLPADLFPSPTASPSAFDAAQANLLRAAAAVVDAVSHPRGAPVAQADLHDLHARLTDARNAWPVALELDLDIEHGTAAQPPHPHVLDLHCLYYSAMIALHRPHALNVARTPGANLAASPSVSICLDAAASLVHLARWALRSRTSAAAAVVGVTLVEALYHAVAVYLALALAAPPTPREIAAVRDLAAAMSLAARGAGAGPCAAMPAIAHWYVAAAEAGFARDAAAQFWTPHRGTGIKTGAGWVAGTAGLTDWRAYEPPAPVAAPVMAPRPVLRVPPPRTPATLPPHPHQRYAPGARRYEHGPNPITSSAGGVLFPTPPSAADLYPLEMPPAPPVVTASVVVGGGRRGSGPTPAQTPPSPRIVLPPITSILAAEQAAPPSQGGDEVALAAVG